MQTMNQKIKYNLGCGTEILEGYINCDINYFPGVDVVCPLWKLRTRDYKLVIDNSVDEIRASHVIEHVPPDMLDQTLQEWYRVLKQGGAVFIYCPNAALIFQDYLDKKIPMEEASRLLFGEHDFSGNVHHTCFDQARLDALVENTGFEVISHEGRPNAYRYELGVHAIKK